MKVKLMKHLLFIHEILCWIIFYNLTWGWNNIFWDVMSMFWCECPDIVGWWRGPAQLKLPMLVPGRDDHCLCCTMVSTWPALLVPARSHGLTGHAAPVSPVSRVARTGVVSLPPALLPDTHCSVTNISSEDISLHCDFWIKREIVLNQEHHQTVRVDTVKLWVIIDQVREQSSVSSR